MKEFSENKNTVEDVCKEIKMWKDEITSLRAKGKKENKKQIREIKHHLLTLNREKQGFIDKGDKNAVDPKYAPGDLEVVDDTYTYHTSPKPKTGSTKKINRMKEVIFEQVLRFNQSTPGSS